MSKQTGPKVYQVKTSELAFYAMIHKDPYAKGDVHIYMGNPTKTNRLGRYCVHLLVSGNDLHIEAVEFDPACSIESNMKKGMLGTIPMLHGALVLAKTLYPNITTLEFTDNSSYFGKPGMHTILADRDMFLYNRTWYQAAVAPINITPTTKQGKKLFNMFLQALHKHTPHSCAKMLKDQAAKQQTTDPDAKTVNTWSEYFMSKDKDTMYPMMMRGIIRDVFELPSLHGLSWSGSMVAFQSPFEFSIKKLSRTVLDTFKTQWGGNFKNTMDRHFGAYDKLGDLG